MLNGGAFSVVMSSHEPLQAAGSQLAGSHDLLKRRKAENGSKHSVQGPMVVCQVRVENEMLQATPLNGHQNRTVRRVERRQREPLPALHHDGLPGTFRGADAASQATVRFDARLSVGIRCDGRYGTDAGAMLASVAAVVDHPRQKRGRRQGLSQAEAAYGT